MGVKNASSKAVGALGRNKPKENLARNDPTKIIYVTNELSQKSEEHTPKTLIKNGSEDFQSKNALTGSERASFDSSCKKSEADDEVSRFSNISNIKIINIQCKREKEKVVQKLLNFNAIQ